MVIIYSGFIKPTLYTSRKGGWKLQNVYLLPQLSFIKAHQLTLLGDILSPIMHHGHLLLVRSIGTMRQARPPSYVGGKPRVPTVLVSGGGARSTIEITTH